VWYDFPMPDGVRVSSFAVPGMDCPSEERLIRLVLARHQGIVSLDFDLPGRQLAVVHRGEPDAIARELAGLGLGATLTRSAGLDEASPAASAAPGEEAPTLRVLLAINAAAFLGEAVAGWVWDSSGLLADSLDMLADAAVYGLALFASGRGGRAQLRAAHASGWLQLALAVAAGAEVLRRAVLGSDPQAPAMVGVSLGALAANVACLLLVSRHRHAGAHMRASFIFSANDVLANLGVIVAGILVAWTGSHLPDLAIGSLIAAVVAAGALRILRLG